MSLVDHLAPLVDRLLRLAQEDDDLRGQLRAVAQAILELTESAGEGTRPQAGAPPPAEALEPAALPATEAVLPAREPLPPLTLGQAVRQEPISIPPVIRWTTPSDSEFPIIEARCRLKAEGCRWARRRRQLLAQGASVATEIEPQDRELIARAKALPECFLWMCHKDGPQPSNLDLYETAAACFENLAEALSVVKQVLDEPTLLENEFEPALDLLAEAQSAVRSIVRQMDGRPDSDQLRVFNWLKETAAENRLYIARYMRMDDPADPQQWPALAAKIEALEGTVQQALQRDKRRRKLLGKVRHKVSLIEADPDLAEPEWRILLETVEELIEGGLPPSNRELREALLPIIDDLPDVEIAEGCSRVLREIDRYFAASPASAPALARREQPPEVQKVARLLEGSSIVLIGGDRRPEAQQAIVEAFGLQELYWIETRDHQSIAGFEPYIARSDVALALLAIRWSSHSFGDAKVFCDRYGKPLVRLPGGYNPRAIAAQILKQCSERLRTHKRAASEAAPAE